MNFEGEYRLVGRCDPAELQSAVGALGEREWLAFAARQQIYRAHSATQTIPLIYDSDMRHRDPTVHPAWHGFASLLAEPMALIRQYYRDHPPDGDLGPGYFVRILLVRLLAGERIGSHRDHGNSLERGHRIHLPILTYPAVEFGIAGHIRHLPAGELWEINNCKVHGVRNPGAHHRVHCILDYVIPGEIVRYNKDMLVC